jgi:hypothetical protein
MKNVTSMPASRSAHRSLLVLGALVVGGVAGAALAGRTGGNALVKQPSVGTDRADASRFVARTIRPPRLDPSVLAGSSPSCFSDPGQANRLLSNTLEMLDRSGEARAPGENLETFANHVSAYLQAVATVTSTLGPGTVAELREAVADDLCAEGATDRRLMVLATLSDQMPDLTSARGLGCFFRQHQSEDAVLHRMLRAWRNSGQPETPEIAALRASVKDPGIRRNFMTVEEERARRQHPLAELQGVRTGVPQPGTLADLIRNENDSAGRPPELEQNPAKEGRSTP